MSTEAERLQHCLDRIAAGEPVDEVLQDYSADAEFASLVRLALTAGRVLPARVPAAMRARQQLALQQRLGAMRVATSASDTSALDSGHGAGTQSPQFWRLPGLRVLALALALVLALGSTVAVSAESLPGDVLYPLKLATEQTRVQLTRDPVARAILRTELVAERLDELQALVDRGVMPAPEVIERLLAAHLAMRRAIAYADDAALSAFGAEESARIADRLRQLSARVAGEDAEAARLLADAADDMEPPVAGTPVDGDGRVGSGQGSAGDDAAAEGPDGGQGGGSGAGAPADERPARVEPGSVATATSPSPTPSALPSRTPQPSATASPSATSTPVTGGGGAPPSEQPRPTSLAATDAPPPPATEPPPEQTEPPEPTTPPFPNPRATERSGTQTP